MNRKSSYIMELVPTIMVRLVLIVLLSLQQTNVCSFVQPFKPIKPERRVFSTDHDTRILSTLIDIEYNTTISARKHEESSLGTARSNDDDDQGQNSDSVISKIESRNWNFEQVTRPNKESGKRGGSPLTMFFESSDSEVGLISLIIVADIAHLLSQHFHHGAPPQC
mmetsp:Transcript_39972/g.48718  ORF Transcript_39972/g.48718 Transcript_39972/m.48718 type:complete len:166 (+) Transcript_39972:165-662(+)